MKLKVSMVFEAEATDHRRVLGQVAKLMKQAGRDIAALARLADAETAPHIFQDGDVQAHYAHRDGRLVKPPLGLRRVQTVEWRDE